MRAFALIAIASVALPAPAGAQPELSAYVPLSAPRPRLPPVPATQRDREVGFQIQLRLHNGLEPVGRGDPRLAGLRALSDRYGLALEPILDPANERIGALIARAEARSGREQPDLRLMYRAVPPPGTPSADLETIAGALHELPVTEWVSIEPELVAPPFDIPPTSDDFTNRQGYAEATAGIDAIWAQSVGLDGAGLRIYDCEYGWDDEHEGLTPQPVFREPGHTEDPGVAERGWDDHGTAVVGVWGAADNAYGVTGMAAGAEFYLYSEWTIEGGIRRLEAITNAIADARVGDLVVLEMQTFGAGGDFAPAEYALGVWQATKVGTDAGVVVVAAAGNGDQDLDDPVYAEYAARGHSGAILVGAGSNDEDHRRLGFSTYGSRIDLQGWGTGVTTLGYGGLARFGNDPHQEYTSGFNGTSSATPIVTSAVALLQQYARDTYGSVLRPAELRDVLVATGRPQSSPSKPIGPLPDVRAAIAELDRLAPRVTALDLPPAMEGSTVTLTLTATRAGGGPLAVRWDVDGVEAVGPSVTLTPADDGAFPVSVTVSDDWPLTTVETGVLTVQNVPPSFEPAVVPTAVEGQLWRIELSTFDPGDDQVTLALESSSMPGPQLVGDALEWTPSLTDVSAGTVRVTVSATDDDGGRDELTLVAPIAFVDEDGDGIADSWERARGYDPTRADDAASDRDADGRTLLDEFLGGTDPDEYDGPPPVELVAPLGGTVRRAITFVVSAAQTSSTTQLVFEWRRNQGDWQQSPGRPIDLDAPGWSFAPGPQFDENDEVQWRAFLRGPFVDGPPSPTATFLYSAINEAPPTPVVSPARLEASGDQYATELTVSEIGIDPEGASVMVDLQILRGDLVVEERSSLAPEPRATGGLEVRLPIDFGVNERALSWTARAVDEDGVASAWAAPAPIIPADESGCTSTRVSSSPGSAIAGILLGLGAFGRRRLREAVTRRR